MKRFVYLVIGLSTLAWATPGIAQEKLTREQMEEDLRQLVAITRRAYAYVEDKKEQGVDFDKLLPRALKRLDSVKSNVDFHDVLKESVAALHDGHCEIYAGHLQAPRPRVWPFTLRFVKEGVVVTEVRPELGPGAEIARGDLVLEINGRPIQAWIEEGVLRASASTEGARRTMALQRMTATADESIKVTRKRPGGEATTVRLGTLPPVTAAPPAGFAEARLLKPSVGYLRIPSFGWHTPAFNKAKTDSERDKALAPARREMDQAFEKVADTKSLILDLRDNGGGADLLGAYLVSHLLPQDFLYYSIQTRCSPDLRKLPGFGYLPRVEGWAPKWSWKPRGTVFTFFRGQTYPGRLIALVDEISFSTTDCALACLVDLHPNLRVVGRPTHGGSGGPTMIGKLVHSKAELQLCIMRVWSPKGRLIEGHGTRPQIGVEWTCEDVLRQRDPDVKAALKEAER